DSVTRLLLAVAFTTTFPAGPVPPTSRDFPMPSRPPNVLLIVADDHQHDALGCHGNKTVKTPTLDALARRGVDFARTYFMGSLIAPVCSPARACLMTGRNVIAADRHPALASGTTSMTSIATDLPLLPELFRS